MVSSHEGRTPPGLPPAVDAVLTELVDGARAVLGARFTGAYLVGSFATGDADRHSDVDFVVAVADDIPLDELAALQSLHGRIHDGPSPWAKRLDGSYVPERILRRQDPRRTAMPYLDNGHRALVPSAHCNRLVIRRQARDSSVTLAGPDPVTLIDPIPTDALRAEVAREMREWADEIRDDPASLDDRAAQPYAVLGYCRMLYTLETGEIASKREAARWAEASLAPEWAGLIRRALAERGDLPEKVRQPADPDEVSRTRRFVAYALEKV